MARLLLNLRNVPDDEAEEVTDLMASHQIDCYRTPPAPFGITAGGIWLRQDDDYQRARALMDDYQAERARRARSALEQARKEGRAETIWSQARKHPGRTVFYLVLAVFILLIFFAPMVQLGSAR